MALHIGSEGTVQIATNVVAEILSFSVDVTTNIIDTSSIGDTWASNQAGMNSFTGSLECHWDETDTDGQGACTEGASVTLSIYPEGSSSGATYYTGTAIVASIGRSTGGNDDTVKVSFSFTGDGALTTSTVA